MREIKRDYCKPEVDWFYGPVGHLVSNILGSGRKPEV